MEEFLNWCANNALALSIGLASIVTLILTIILCTKNRTSVAKYMFALIVRLPKFIVEAESKGFVNGEAKFKYVFTLAVTYLSSLLGLSVEATSQKYGAAIEESIEDILSTPQKKGE